MPSGRTVLRALLPFALHALAREVDAAVGVLLHTTLDLPGFVVQSMRLLDGAAVARHVLLWVAAGAAIRVVLGRERARPLTFAPLYLRPALTLLALLSLALRPAFPYAFTLPVALTQDWGIAQDAAALAAIAASSLPRLRLPAPNAGGVFLVAFLAYALLTPERARVWEGHPGNEPKYLRMGVSLGWALSLDVEQVSAAEDIRPPMEALDPEPLLPAAGRAAGTLSRESLRMLRAGLEGPRALGAGAIRATRVARQTVRGKQGGIFHVLAPGPSLLLAPTLRLDRIVNLLRGTPGRLAVSVLAWNALAAALAAALFLLLRDVTGRPGLAALLAGGFALTPPFLFYFFQFYPEMPGALLLVLALRPLLFRTRWTGRTTLALGLLLAALPWLHQKFLPVWGVLALMALVKAVEDLVTLRALAALVLPQAATLLLFALYNFAITGSVRPDALFLAWGPGGVTSARIGEGALGLLLDARYGILPYAPIHLLAAGGALVLARAGARGRPLLLALPPLLAYYLTVAAADNWSGSVCNLGRYVMPALPLLCALVGVALDRTGPRRGVLALALALGAWTGLLSWALWRDPVAANDSALLLARSTFADGNVYVPNLFFRSWNYAAPGHAARVIAWLLAALGLGLWLGRVARGRGGESPARALAGSVLVVLAAAVVLERWPSPLAAPRFPNALQVAPGVTAFVSGSARVQGDRVLVGGGEAEVLVRSRAPVQSLRIAASGPGTLRLAGRPPIVPPPSGSIFDVPLSPLCTLADRSGGHEALSRLDMTVETPGEVSLRLALPSLPPPYVGEDRRGGR